MKYDLHCVLNEKLLFDLKNISVDLKTKSISGTIVSVIETFMPYLEKYQNEFQNRKSEYKLIAKKNEKRHHFHVYFPDNIYRKLKELHQYLNFYSMAQIIREMLQLYINEFYKNGIDKVQKKITEIRNKWAKWKSKQKDKEIIKPLVSTVIPIPSICVTYDANYHPYKIKYLSYTRNY
jgi:hypothetical protein